MTDLSRISKKSYKHPKFVKARRSDPGSISLWLLMNCYCRDHRTQGFVNREIALEFGTDSEIAALLGAGLWVEVEGGYRFWDWDDWNPDLIRNGPVSSAAWLVSQEFGDHPFLAQQRLAAEVGKLIDEGVPLNAIRAGLVTLRERKDARFQWLPYFVSDALRLDGCGVRAAVEKARSTLDLAPLAEFGFRWEPPDAPDDARSAKAMRQFMREQKLAWLDRIEANLGSETSA